MYLYEGPQKKLPNLFNQTLSTQSTPMAFAFLSHVGLLYILPHVVCQKIANDYPSVQHLIGSSSWPEQAVWKGRSGSILPQPQCIIEKLRFHLGSRCNKFCRTINCSQKYHDKLCHLKLMKQKEKNHSQTTRKGSVNKKMHFSKYCMNIITFGTGV